MSNVIGLSLIAVFASLLVLLSERSETFRHFVKEQPRYRRGFYVINVLLYLLLVQTMSIAGFDYVGLLFSDVHQAIVIIGIVPTIGWTIVYTQMIEGKKRGDSEIDGLAYAIALEAKKSKTPREEIPRLIRKKMKEGYVSKTGAMKIVELLGERADDIGVLARGLSAADLDAD